MGKTFLTMTVPDFLTVLVVVPAGACGGIEGAGIGVLLLIWPWPADIMVWGGGIGAYIGGGALAIEG